MVVISEERHVMLIDVFNRVDAELQLSCLKALLYWDGREQIEECEKDSVHYIFYRSSEIQFSILEAALNTRNDEIITFIDEYIQKEKIVVNKPNMYRCMIKLG